MRSLNTLSLISASLLHVTRGHMTQEIPSATVPTSTFNIIFIYLLYYIYSYKLILLSLYKIVY